MEDTGLIKDNRQKWLALPFVPPAAWETDPEPARRDYYARYYQKEPANG